LDGRYIIWGQIVRNRWFLVAILLGCLAIASGCGSDQGADGEQASDVAPTPQSTENPFGILDVVWTSGVDEQSGEPIDEVDSFTTVSPRIVAVVQAENVPAGTVFTATWTIDGLEVPEATMEATVDADMATAWVAFEFIRAEGRYFPLGELEVSVAASNGETIQDSVRIELP
jgi:hypothetical protein